MARRAATRASAAPATGARTAAVKASPGRAAKPTTASRKTAARFDRSPPKLEGHSLEKQVAMLLADRQALIAALEASEARAAEVADRIAWALDTLEDLLGRRA